MEENVNWIEMIQMLREMKSKLSYHFNIIDELGANENAHTRILIKFLKYKGEDSSYPILKSFLKMISNYCPTASFQIVKPNIQYGTEYIDGLIEEDLYAVIIENKIRWAVDQDKQLERYVEQVRLHGGPTENIYVIYLTSDGSKKVESYSLTNKTKQYLGMTEEDNGRFIPMNYNRDILPWLKEDVLPNLKYKEELLITGIKQYIDYLEGLLGLRKTDKNINRVMKKELYNKLSINVNEPISVQYNKLLKAGESLEELMGRINQIKDEIAKESNVCLDFDKITQDYFGDLFGNSRKIGINNNIRQGDGFYFIHYEEWSWPIHFEWLPLSVDKLMFEKNYTLYLHIEGNLVPFKKYILEDEEYKQLVKSIGGKINNRDKVTAFQKQYIADKPFVDMTYDEKKVFLESAYGEVTPMISIIDRLLKAYKSKESDKISK